MTETPDQTEPDFEDALDLLVPGAKGQANILFKIEDELGRESDRGCALVAAAYLENEMTELLKRFFVTQGSKATKALFDFNGPVGTFSSKIRLSLALGLIPEEIQSALDLIRNLRNDFAHLHEPLNFESPTIRQRIRRLLPSMETASQSTRQNFIAKIKSIAATIHLCLTHVHQQTVPPFEQVPVHEDASEQEIEIAAHRLMKITSPDITYEQAVEMARKLREIN